MLFQALDFHGWAAVVDPQQFGVAARPRVEHVFLPEIRGRVGEQRHAIAVRHGLAQHPAVSRESLRRQIIDYQLRVAFEIAARDGLQDGRPAIGGPFQVGGRGLDADAFNAVPAVIEEADLDGRFGRGPDPIEPLAHRLSRCGC
ncbi:hypothetical protein G6F35_015244 [Rhizopus arrhizus]|nr:hypothetical protein G6F35_015244 [Rhizopus arrhizus]